MMLISKSIMEKIAGIDSFRRVSDTHPLDLYVGLDTAARPTLLLISKSEPTQVFSSKLIGIQVGRRADGRWSLSFSLNDMRSEDMFFHFCDDLIKFSAEAKDKKQGAVLLCERYIKWQELLRRNASGLLSFSEVKGLIGELIFLKKFLFDKYGVANALLTWIGPDKADQDFVCEDAWYEVKATVSGTESILISSIEQLDNLQPGELVVVYLDKTSRSDSCKVTLNSLVSQIAESLITEEQERIFRNALFRQGYVPREEYDEYVFRLSGLKRYRVDNSFPSLRRSDVPASVGNARYSLTIASIAGYLKED